MNKIKLIVINNHTLGYIDPLTPMNYSTLHSSILKGAIFNLHPSSKHINKTDNIRLASESDFNDFRVSFDGFKNSQEYEYKY